MCFHIDARMVSLMVQLVILFRRRCKLKIGYPLAKGTVCLQLLRIVSNNLDQMYGGYVHNSRKQPYVNLRLLKDLNR